MVLKEIDIICLNICMPIVAFVLGILATVLFAYWYDQVYTPWRYKRDQAKEEEKEYRRKVEALYKALDKPIYLDGKDIRGK